MTLIISPTPLDHDDLVTALKATDSARQILEGLNLPEPILAAMEELDDMVACHLIAAQRVAEVGQRQAELVSIVDHLAGMVGEATQGLRSNQHVADAANAARHLVLVHGGNQ